MYVKKFDSDDFIILLIYFADMLIIRRDKIEKLKKELSKSFDTKDFGPAKQLFGMKISHDRKTRRLWVSHVGYIQKVLERFSMHHAKLVGSPLTTFHIEFTIMFLN